MGVPYEGPNRKFSQRALWLCGENLISDWHAATHSLNVNKLKSTRQIFGGLRCPSLLVGDDLGAGPIERGIETW